MNANEKIPGIDPPVVFNPYKHHLGFLKNRIEKWRQQEWADVEKELLNIGNNLIDLYCGELTVNEISHQCLAFAKNNHITSPEELASWLKPMKFRKTEFSDKSSWAIKQGMDTGRFLHIHPGKYSPFTLRVRGTTLKTVVALKVFEIQGKGSGEILGIVNKIRVKNLGLSPVKTLEKGKGIDRLWNIFNSP